jgi:hypothetical protein
MWLEEPKALGRGQGIDGLSALLHRPPLAAQQVEERQPVEGIGQAEGALQPFCEPVGLLRLLQGLGGRAQQPEHDAHVGTADDAGILPNGDR